MTDTDALWGEIAGLTRELVHLQKELAEMETTLCRHDELLQENGFSDLKICVGELKQLVYGDPKVGAAGVINRLKEVEEANRALTRQRDQLKWIVIGVSLSGLAQAGVLVSIFSKVFGGAP